MLSYNFGPQHPLVPERLRRTMELIQHMGAEAIDPGEGSKEDLLRVHGADYVEAVQRLSDGEKRGGTKYGFGDFGDNPPFSGMYEAALAYSAGSAAAARAVRDGENLAYNLGGGLHHARNAQASGFCVFNDCAIAIHILREKFQRVAYVDIDVHHGDGVQWLFFDDPAVLTCSIHQDGRTIYPGTGFVEETGAAFTSLNVPLLPRTTGDVWLWAFQCAVVPALERFKPEAIALQMGTDSHYLDRLGNLSNTAQEWTEAVRLVRDFGVPIVALGGGGYTLTCVPRMWIAASLTLAGEKVPEKVPEPFATQWDMPFFLDPTLPEPRDAGKEQAETVVAWLERELLPNMPV